MFLSRHPGHVLALFVLAVLLLAPVAWAQPPAGNPADDTGSELPAGQVLLIAVLCGALGGIVYELITFHGNVELPHRTVKEDLPEEGVLHTGLAQLRDLGIVARMIVGAGAAVIIFWILEVPASPVKLVALCLVAGSVGTAIFRSLQDRLLTAVQAERQEAMNQVVESMEESMADADAPPAPPAQPDAALQGQVGAAGAAHPAPPPSANPQLAEVRGQLKALKKLAARA